MNYGITTRPAPLQAKEQKTDGRWYARIALHQIDNEVTAIETLLPNEPTDEDFAELANSYVANCKEIFRRKIDEYDISENVNGFFVNEQLAWLDKATRVGLRNSLTVEKEAGHETTTLYLNGTALVLPVDDVLHILDELELYAIECYRKTEEHKAEVEALSTVEQIVNYNYTTGYPERPVFNV